MNRIKLSPLAKKEFAGSPAVTIQERKKPAKSTAVSFDECSNELLDYSLFIPQHYEVKYAYPLVVWLHSDGSDHRQLLKMMPHLSHRNYAAISISSPQHNNTQSLRSETSSWQQNRVSIEQTAAQIEVSVDHAKLRLNIDPRRIFIAGNGSGGTMAMRIAFAFPHWFAGIISLNGKVPESRQPLGGWLNCRRLPLFWTHARRSSSFDEETLCQNLKLLHVAGFSIVLKQYPCDDELDPQVFCDMNAWIMETIAEFGDADSIVR